MSLNIWLKPEKCESCGNKPDDREYNYTYNCRPMWFEFYPDARNMVDIDGMTGAESVPRLDRIIQDMYGDPGKYIRHNPPNSWGCYATFLKFLEELKEEAIKHPYLVWDSWR